MQLSCNAMQPSELLPPLHIGAVNARAIVIFDIIEFVRRLVLVFRQTGLDNF